MPRLSNKDFAVKFAQTFASNMFNDMLLVENQGKNFSWQKFPEDFKGLAASRLFMHLPSTPKNIEELKEIVRLEFHKEVVRLMDEYKKEKPLPVAV